FLSKFALFGAAPLLLHLVVPLMHAFSDTSTRGFWGAMRDYLGAQKNLVLNYRRVTALFLGSISLLPLLCVAFRWGESKGDISGASHQITSWMTHLVHLGFLIVGLAAAFEFPGRGPDSPEISVRYLAATAGDPYALSVYFLCALSAGYCAGYFLLVFGTPSIHRWERSSALSSALGKGVVALVGILLVGVPGSLIYLNWATRSESRGPALARYGSRMLEAAPDGSFLISDDATLNQLAHASLAATGRRGKVTPFDSGSLSIGLFHAHMAKTLPGRWPALPEKPERDDRVDARYMNLTLTRLSLSNHVSYTQPSFGFFFEAHTLSPTGLLYRLRPLPVRTLPSNSLEASAVSAAEGHLKGIADAEFAPVLAKMPRRKGELIKDFGAALAAQSYSRALNYWGVAARRAGFLDAGERFYRQALVINSNNPSAAINLAFTEYSKREPGKPLPITDALKDLLKPYAGQPDRSLSANGPLDEPSNLTVYSRYFWEQSTLYLQSAMMLLRAAELSGGTPALQLGAARLLAEGRRSDLSSMVLTKIRSTAPKEFLSDTTNHLELVELEAVAAHRDGDFPKAEKMLSDAIARYPKENGPYTALLSLHLQTAMSALRRKETNEYQSHIARGYQILQSQLAVQPTNVSAWVNFGATYMRLEDYSNALPAFAKALEMDKGNVTALLNRANCYFRLNQFAAAEQDYLRIRTLMPDSPFQVHYGLGEIASRTGRKKDAIQNFEEYLKKAPEIPEKETVRNKLKELKK
ncbi:MAG: tetratricopeptide repeat protein, partial [Verrucomicrobia bacterium]|nr:tetratricopeptide repeat protein [Verrucomicrobiota bacterium]